MSERSRACGFGESSSILSSSSLREGLGSSLSPLRRGGEADRVGDLVAALAGDLDGDLVAERWRASGSGEGEAASTLGVSFASGEAGSEDIVRRSCWSRRRAVAPEIELVGWLNWQLDIIACV